MSTTSQHIASHPSMELSFPASLATKKSPVKPWPHSLAGWAVIASVEDLKTALGEACINAIEHGNGHVPGLRVDVSCVGADDRLEIQVHDRGLKRYEAGGTVAGIDLKLRAWRATAWDGADDDRAARSTRPASPRALTAVIIFGWCCTFENSVVFIAS